MTIAELFVELGIKGSEKTVQGMKNIKNGLGEIKSLSLETKAAILGALYGLEKMMSQSAQMGTGLTNFTALTGLSAKTLQQWQYAARQAGVSSEEFTGNLKGVQSAMTNMLMGKGAPEGMGLLANKVGFDPKRARDTFYVMEQLQKFARSGVPEDLSNNVMKSFGLGEGTIAAMRRNVFQPDTFKRAPLYSEGETKQLDKVNVAWSNLGQKIQMAFGRFTSKHGMQIVTDIGNITMGVIKLADALTSLADKLKVFDIFTTSIDGLTKLMRLASGESLDEIMKGDNKKGKRTFGQGTWWMNAIEGAQNKVLDLDVQQRVLDMDAKREWRKSQGPTTQGGGLVVNQNLNFQHDGKDHGKTGESVNKAVQKAYRQNSALKGGY